jgi:hypothetical protein
LSDKCVVGNAFGDSGGDMFGLFRSKEDSAAAAEILEIIAWDQADKETINTSRLKLHELTNCVSKRAMQSVDAFLTNIKFPGMLSDWNEGRHKMTRKLHVKTDESISYIALVRDAGEHVHLLF